MIAISLLDTDILRLAEEVDSAMLAGIDFVHLNFGHSDSSPVGCIPTICESLRHHGVSCPIDIRLPDNISPSVVTSIINAGASWISIAPEMLEADGMLSLIRNGGCKAGLVVKPSTELEKYSALLKKVDYLLFQFNKETAERSDQADALLESAMNARMTVDRYNHNIQLAAYGVIVEANARALSKAGFKIFILGEPALPLNDYYTAIASLRKQVT